MLQVCNVLPQEIIANNLLAAVMRRRRFPLIKTPTHLLVCRFAMIYHMSKEVARNRADTMPALPAVVNAAVAAKYFLSRIQKFF